MSRRRRSSGNRVADHMTRRVFALRLDRKRIPPEELLEWAHVRYVPVVDAARKVVGIVNHRDLLMVSIASGGPSAGGAQRRHPAWTIPITGVMRRPVITILPEATLQEAAHVMRTRKIGCLPVVKNGRLVGIITQYDLLRVVAGA